MKSKKITLIFACFFLSSYCLAMLFFSLPDNPFYVEIGIDPETLRSAFRQEWTLFAPSPVKNSYRLLIKCDGKNEIDPIGDIVKKHRSFNDFSKKYYVYSNLVEFSYSALSKESLNLCKDEEICSAGIYRFLNSRYFSELKEKVQMFCHQYKFERIENLSFDLAEIAYPRFSNKSDKLKINRIKLQ